VSCGVDVLKFMQVRTCANSEDHFGETMCSSMMATIVCCVVWMCTDNNAGGNMCRYEKTILVRPYALLWRPFNQKHVQPLTT